MIELGYETCDGQKIADMLADSIENVKSITGSVVAGLVTDNASNMRKAWSILHDRFPRLITLGCFAHGLSLFVGDILCKISSCARIADQCLNVVNTVRDSPKLLSRFRYIQMEKSTLFANLCVQDGSVRP